MPTRFSSSSFDRPRWTEQDARNALAALQRSGKAVSVFAAEQGLDPQRLYSWRRRLGKAEPTTFQEVIVRPASRISVTDGEAPFELVLASGVIVRVPTSFNAAALERLLEVLRTGAC
jgi:transposase-like protein